jgi:hypothetical protein
MLSLAAANLAWGRLALAQQQLGLKALTLQLETAKAGLRLLSPWTRTR